MAVFIGNDGGAEPVIPEEVSSTSANDVMHRQEADAHNALLGFNGLYPIRHIGLRALDPILTVVED